MTALALSQNVTDGDSSWKLSYDAGFIIWLIGPGREDRGMRHQFILHMLKDRRFWIEPGGSPKLYRMPVCSVSGQLGDEAIHLFVPIVLPFSFVPITAV